MCKRPSQFFFGSLSTTRFVDGVILHRVNFFTTLVVFITKNLGSLGRSPSLMDYDELEGLMAYWLIIYIVSFGHLHNSHGIFTYLQEIHGSQGIDQNSLGLLLHALDFSCHAMS